MGTNFEVRPRPCGNPCEHCLQPRAIHLGKSSHGWEFTFRAYLPVPGTTAIRSEVGPVVDDFASWLRLLDLGDVYSETGGQWSREELLELIRRKRGGRCHSTTDSQVIADLDGNHFITSEFC